MAFGGPQAHVAILRDHLVVQRDWLEEEAFMELFAIGQVSTHLSLYSADDEYSHRANCILIFLLLVPGPPGSLEYPIGHFRSVGARGSTRWIAGILLVEFARIGRPDRLWSGH